jgi:hypothetical protein
LLYHAYRCCDNGLVWVMLVRETNYSTGITYLSSCCSYGSGVVDEMKQLLDRSNVIARNPPCEQRWDVGVLL